MTEEVNFVIRLTNKVPFFGEAGQPMDLSVSKGETRNLNKVFYKGKVIVNQLGIWYKGFSEPMWIMPNLDAKQAFAICPQRM